MRLKYTFEIVDTGSELIAVPIGLNAKELRGVVKLNAEGSEIFHLLQTDISEEEIVEILSQKYENNKDILRMYVHTFLNSLLHDNLIEV